MKQTKPMHHILWGIQCTVYRGMPVIKRKAQTWPRYIAKAVRFERGDVQFQPGAMNIAQRLTKT